jgi:beta-fructofuranosidase
MHCLPPKFAWPGLVVLAICLGTSLLSCADSTGSAGVPEPKSVAHWDFNDCDGGSLVDKSGNGLNGGIVGAKCAEGIQGNSLRFNGITDFVHMGTSTRLDLDSNMSLSVWISPSDMAATDYWYEIAAKRNKQNSTFGLNLKVGGSAAPYAQWYFGDGSSFLSVSDTIPLADETWTHIVVTREIKDGGSLMTFFANGVLVKTGRIAALPKPFPNSPFTIGCNSDGIAKPSFFKGRIDELSVYDFALNPAEVAGLYKSIRP